MKSFNLFLCSVLLFVSHCYAITCEDVQSLLNIEYEGNCCDLQQVNCDEANETILSIETLLNIPEQDIQDIDVDEIKEINPVLYRRKGGRGGGGSKGSSKSSSSSSIGSSSSSTNNSGSVRVIPIVHTGHSYHNNNHKSGNSTSSAFPLASAPSTHYTFFVWLTLIALFIKIF